MIHAQITGGIARAGVLLTLVMTTGCYKPIDPVFPTGDAAYDTLGDADASADVARYTLLPGDKISVRVFGEDDLSLAEAFVDNAGRVNMPLIGDVQAEGRTAGELAIDIEAAYGARFLRDPQVSVAMLNIRERTITVEGEVRLPGVYPFREGQTLLTALAQSQSPTERAKLDEVIVFRTIEGRANAAVFDVRDIRAGRAPNLKLHPGDIVVVGYSAVRAGYMDAVRALPVLGLFTPIV